MKKLIFGFLLSVLVVVLSPSVISMADSVPEIYINGNEAEIYDSCMLVNSTVYVAPDAIARTFNLVLSVDTESVVYTFSNKVRTITYDAGSGSVNISDRNSFMYNVIEDAYPSYSENGKVYIPIRMICYGLYMDVNYIAEYNRVEITGISDSVGLFNNDGSAVAYRGGKFGIVNSTGEVLLKFSYDAITNYDNNSLYKITYNHKHGLADSRGRILTDVIYNEITYESPACIYLESEGLKGMCDISGNIIITVGYDDIIYCANRIAMVRLGKNWHILDCTKDELSFETYDEVYKITAGIQSDNHMIQGYYVMKNGKWGCVDSFGKLVIELKYDALDKFDTFGRARVILNGKFGVVDCGGRTIIPTAYDYIDTFDRLNVTVAQVGDKYGIIDYNHNVVVSFEYDYIYPFNNSVSSVAYKNDKFGVISASGELFTGFNYKYMEEFKNGMALAYDDGYGYINHYGQEVIKLEHDEVKQGTTTSVFLKKQGKWALFSSSGFNLTGYNFTNANGFSNGLAAVCVKTSLGESYGYVNDSGDTVIPFVYSMAQDFKYGKAIVSKGKYSGIIDIEGNEIIPFVYTGFNPSYDYGVIAAANEYSKWGLISLDNRKIVDFEYDYIFEFTDGYAYTLKNNKYGVVDEYGNILAKAEHKTKEDAYASILK